MNDDDAKYLPVPGMVATYSEIIEKGRTYQIHLEQNGQKSIECLLCGLQSFHPKDVEHRYCDKCHKFHVKGRAPWESPNESPGSSRSEDDSSVGS